MISKFKKGLKIWWIADGVKSSLGLQGYIDMLVKLAEKWKLELNAINDDAFWES